MVIHTLLNMCFQRSQQMTKEGWKRWPKWWNDEMMTWVGHTCTHMHTPCIHTCITSKIYLNDHVWHTCTHVTSHVKTPKTMKNHENDEKSWKMMKNHWCLTHCLFYEFPINVGYVDKWSSKVVKKVSKWWKSDVM